mmetsp:Transcript_2042/g.4388  ORF Transcript_2042/g.4388 Transcript_2042/m.4388 type:complete len:218 (-) Transcript_2042:33-686(-)
MLGVRWGVACPRGAKLRCSLLASLCCCRDLCCTARIIRAGWDGAVTSTAAAAAAAIVAVVPGAGVAVGVRHGLRCLWVRWFGDGESEAEVPHLTRPLALAQGLNRSLKHQTSLSQLTVEAEGSGADEVGGHGEVHDTRAEISRSNKSGLVRHHRLNRTPVADGADTTARSGRFGFDHHHGPLRFAHHWSIHNAHPPHRPRRARRGENPLRWSRWREW